MRQIIDNAVLWMKENYPDRTNEYEKCYRDLEYICNAIEKDCINDTTDHITRIGNMFWQDDVRMVETYEVEIATYKFLLNEYSKHKNEETFLKVKRSIDKLIHIVEHGISADSAWHKIVNASKNANHCQRNWSFKKQIPSTTVDSLIHVATNMPTKQNLELYRLIVSTNRDLNHSLYQLSISEDGTPKNRNSQIDANVVFVYCINTEYDSKNSIDLDLAGAKLHYAIGISSGAVSLAANQMGLRTGFCQCYLGTRVRDLLISKGVKLKETDLPELMLGIGIPNKKYKWTDVVKRDKIINEINPHFKNITVDLIN